MQHGIVLKQINFLDFNVTNLYIKDTNGLHVDIESINFKHIKNTKTTNFKYEDINKTVDSMQHLLALIKSIHIKSIKVNKNNISINYKKNKTTYIDISNKDISLKLSLQLTKKYLNMEILKFNTLDNFLHVKGIINLNRTTGNIYTKLQTDILHADKQEVFLVADKKGIRFNTRFLTDISTLDEIVKYVDLHKNIRPWIVEYAKGDNPHLKKLSGFIPYDNPSYIVHTLKAQGYWSGISYYFQKGFEPAVSHKVDLIFNNGILKIMPRNAYFYSHKAGNTSISIDFKPKEAILCVHIDTTATLDKNLLNLIKSYDIDIPVEQKMGLTKTDLKIYVNLQTDEVSADGNFDVYKSSIAFNGVDYQVYSGKVKIQDTNVKLKDVNASYKHLAKAMLNADIQAASQKGKIDIDLYDINISNRLKILTKPLHVRYNMIANSLDRIDVEKSDWKFLDKNLHVNAVKSDFDYDKLKAYVPKTDVNITNSLQAKLYGCIDIAKDYYDFNATVFKYNLYNLALKEKELHVRLNYDNKLSLISEQHSRWDYSGLNIEVEKLYSVVDLNDLKINSASFILNNDLKANIVGNYHLSTSKGNFKLENISVKNDKLGEILSHKESMPLKLKLINNSFDISIPQFNFSLMALKEGWRLNIPDISQFARYSKLMQDFNVTNGSLHIGKTRNKSELYFNGILNYTYPLLVENNTPQTIYEFSGNFDNNTTMININDTLDIKIGKKIALTCKDVGFNVNAFIDYMNDHNSSDSSESMKFSLDANNSFIYFSDNRKALADKLTIKAEGDNLLAVLIHKKSGAIFEMHNNKFYLYGKNFNDTFMNYFLSLSKYKGGSFSFTLRGTFDNFKGIARIENSQISDYVLFNNLLAFVNTIPSLASFALPSYAKDGIKINQAYASFEYKNDIMYFNAIDFDSGEVNIYGKGKADYLNDKINIKLNLKTHLGKNVSKLPVVGFILVGDDGTAATTFDITGKLTDPNVETALAKDIIIAPFNIVKRAIIYPFHLIQKLIEDDNVTKELNSTHFLIQ